MHWAPKENLVAKGFECLKIKKQQHPSTVFLGVLHIESQIMEEVSMVSSR